MRGLILIYFGLFAIACSNRSSQNNEQLDYESFANSLDSIMALDQGIRKKFMDAMQANEKIEFSLYEEMNRIDSSNQVWVINKLQKYGWPEKSKIGDNAARAVFLVIQHAELSDIETYYPQLQALADRDEALPVHAAMMLDRMLMYQGKKQVYGTQSSGQLRDDGSWVIWPVENPETINERRKGVGFTDTVEETAASMDAIYNPDEPLPSVD
ncbi:DUF6624 domain-containing protein [Aquiflexum sp.]|uniref:DUF6624 domain-containing protein n=1 Tax=Aquiflexum sp. TaxID=1872584 RepID=UPI0035948992